MKPKRRINIFKRLSMLTMLAVYFLILVGGIVRTTGSGMGCPDWPKCFGQWIPPTEESQLPLGYEELYSSKRLEKNKRLAASLESLGFNNTAKAILNDPEIGEPETFNATKTWIEYINRLIGALIGLFILATFVYSLLLIRHKWSYSLIAFLSLVLVIFQAWIGSIVVSTNLLPGMISVHMMLALLLVGLLIYLYRDVERGDDNHAIIETSPRQEVPRQVKWFLMAGMLLMLPQIVLGTQVREQVDILLKELGDRSLIVEELNVTFLVHRSFSLVILAVQLYALFLIYIVNKTWNSVNRSMGFLTVLILLEIFSGAAMAYFSIPAWLQPVHLLIGLGIVGVQFYIFLVFQDHKTQRLQRVSL